MHVAAAAAASAAEGVVDVEVTTVVAVMQFCCLLELC